MLVAALALAGGAALGHGHPAAAGDPAFQPPFQAGPHGGDQYNEVVVQPRQGRVSVARAYPYPGLFNCAGAGGYGTLLVTSTLTAPTSAVTVAYANGAWDSYTWLTVLVRDAAGDYLGAHKLRGPVAGDGSVTVPVADPSGSGPVAAGTPVSVQFGLEVASACPNVDGGSVQFTEVTLGSGGTVSRFPPALPSPPPRPAGLTVPSGVVTTVNFEFVPGDQDFLKKVPLEVQESMGLVYVNADVTAPHTVTADTLGPDGLPLFDSGEPISAGQATPVVGVAALVPGTYSFHCKVHTSMHGTLRILKPLPVEAPRIPRTLQ